MRPVLTSSRRAACSTIGWAAQPETGPRHSRTKVNSNESETRASSEDVGLSYRPRWYHPESRDARSLLTALICDENHKLRYEWSHPDSVPPAKLNISMNEFGILNSRKRALIALVHSVVFLGDCDAWLRFTEGGNPRPRPGTDSRHHSHRDLR